MKKNIYYYSIIIALMAFSNNLLNAQGIGINETGGAPNPSAGLDVDFEDKGFLFPRMTTAQRNSIASPAQGLQIFNLDTDCIEVYFAQGGWKAIDCGCSTLPDATFSNPGGFANVPLNLSANTNVATNTYSWSFNSGTPATSNNSSENITWTTAGTYPVTLTVTDINNCTAFTTENVVIGSCASFPDATFTGGNSAINSPIAFSANGSGAGYTYAWSFPSGTPSTSAAQNPSVQWAAAGTYTVELTVTDNLGCPSTETMEVTISLCSENTYTFNYTGTVQTLTVPFDGIYIFDVYGAQGGSTAFTGGLGGRAQGELNLTAGDVINIYVGEQPTNANGGWNGGGNSGGNGRGGGGASDIRIGGVALTDRVIVAAGGGGGGITSSGFTGTSGANGGGLTGSTSASSSGGFSSGTGGTQSTGGTSTGCCGVGFNGSLGLGGNGTNSTTCGTSYLTAWGGGGGGGYYGGGGGGNCGGGVGGGGGSSFIGGVSGGSTSAGVRSGNGQIIITNICP